MARIIFATIDYEGTYEIIGLNFSFKITQVTFIDLFLVAGRVEKQVKSNFPGVVHLCNFKFAFKRWTSY